MFNIDDKDKKIMLDEAKNSIIYGLDTMKCKKVDIKQYSTFLCEPRACFITIKKHNNLRGCIGSLEPNGPLILNIVENAFKAAFYDPRFPPITKQDLNDTIIEISVLTEPEIISFKSEEELLTKIQPNIDGLILTYKNHKGTFLPSVWEDLPTPKDFLQHLKYKSGLMPDFWDDSIIVQRYRTEKIGYDPKLLL